MYGEGVLRSDPLQLLWPIDFLESCFNFSGPGSLCVLQFQVADSKAHLALQTCFKEPGAHRPSLLFRHVLNGTGTREISLPHVTENR